LELNIGEVWQTIICIIIFLSITIVGVNRVMNKYADLIEIEIKEHCLTVSFTNIGGSIQIDLKPVDISHFTQGVEGTNGPHFHVIARNPKYNLYLQETIRSDIHKHRLFINQLESWLIQNEVRSEFAEKRF